MGETIHAQLWMSHASISDWTNNKNKLRGIIGRKSDYCSSYKFIQIHIKKTEIDCTHSSQNGNQEQIAHRCQEPELELENKRSKQNFNIRIFKTKANLSSPPLLFLFFVFLEIWVKAMQNFIQATFTSWFLQHASTLVIHRSIHENMELLIGVMWHLTILGGINL